MLDPMGYHYLEKLLRFGLDKDIYNNYRKYGIISCSEMNCGDSIAKAFHFIDYAGIEEEWIDKIVQMEQDEHIKVFYIIHTKPDEFKCLYEINIDDYISESNYFSMVDKLTEHYKNFNKNTITQCFTYNTTTNKISYGSVKIKVRLGVIVED